MTALVAAAAIVGGCGSAARPARQVVSTAPAAPARPVFTVGVVGAVPFEVAGVAVVHGSLTRVVGNPLVLVEAGRVSPAELALVARANPATDFAVIGGTAGRRPLRNVAGVLVRAGDAAYLSGTVAALVAHATGTQRPTVTLVGPAGTGVVTAFRRGVSDAAPGVSATATAAGPDATLCKEAALAAIDAGAVAVVGTDDACAAGVLAAAAERNVVGESLVADFELPSVAVAAVVQAAAAGHPYRHEDVRFGYRAGAVGIVHLDPLVPTAVAIQARAAAQRLAEGR